MCLIKSTNLHKTRLSVQTNKLKMAYSCDLAVMDSHGLSWMTFMDDFHGCLSWMTVMDNCHG